MAYRVHSDDCMRVQVKTVVDNKFRGWEFKPWQGPNKVETKMEGQVL